MQSFPNPVRTPEAGEGFICDSSDQQAYKQFGNSVNVEVMRRCTQELFDRY